MRNRFVYVFLAVCVVVSFSCHQPDVVIDMGTKVVHPGSVRKLDINSAGYGVTRLEGLSAEDDIFLAKVKNGRVKYNRHMLPVNSGAGQEEGQSLAGVVTTETGETFLRYERRWQVTPPAEETQSRNRMRSLVETDVGDRRDFFVDVSFETSAFELKTATLKEIGAYCKVWVVDEYFSETGSELNKVTQDKIKALADTFDLIYPLETNLLGYECGGGPGGDGGIDGDPKIQILVFDIDGDEGIGSQSITYGYFYPGDEFVRGETYPRSNEAEIFYIDSYSLVINAQAMYSTLIHEFNHMINFNLKVLAGGDYLSWNTEVWYTEMLSMLAEDVIGPLVGISSGQPGHVIYNRIPKWIKKYADLSVMYWPPSSGEALYYYSSNYAFGAYLMRNFGGPALFSAIAKSNSAGRGSIDGFMRIFNGIGIDTAYALARFSEALVYSGASAPIGVLTFDKTVTDMIGSTVYTFAGFDIWSMNDFPSPDKGPLIREYRKMPEYATPDNVVQLYTDKDAEGNSNWENQIKETGGKLEMKLLNVEADADYYIMTKPKESESGNE